MIVIKSISVQNYKNISDSNLEFSNFNIITGPNNSGKSNFIQIFSFLNFLINGAFDKVEESFKNGFFPSPFSVIMPQLFNNEKSDSKTEIGLTLFDTEIEHDYFYSIEIDWKGIEEVPMCSGRISKEIFQYKNIRKTGKPTTIFIRTEEELHLTRYFKKLTNVSKISKYSSVFKLLKTVSTENNDYSKAINSLEEVLKTPIYYFSNFELSKSSDIGRVENFKGRTIGFNLEKEISLLEKTDKWPLFKEVLKSILNINEIEILRLNRNFDKVDKINLEDDFVFCRIDHLNERKPLNTLSDGSMLIFALVTKILNSNNSIFLLEEPENSLHPKALKELINFLRSFEDEKQFIISSHSIVLINMVKPENVIVSKVNENCISELSNIKNARELRRQLKNGTLDFSDFIFFNTEELEEEISEY